MLVDYSCKSCIKVRRFVVMAVSAIRRSLALLRRISAGNLGSWSLRSCPGGPSSFPAVATTATSSCRFTAVAARTMTSSSSGGGGGGSRLDLSGVYPPIATPFDDHENVDYDKLDFNLQRWNDVPFRGLQRTVCWSVPPFLSLCSSSYVLLYLCVYIGLYCYSVALGHSYRPSVTKGYWHNICLKV